MRPAEVVPGDTRSGHRDALEVLGARDRRRRGRRRPAERGAILADREELHPAVGSGSSVSGASKSRVLRTNSVP